MKTTQEWLAYYWQEQGSGMVMTEFIERIQKDALSDPLANLSDQQELELAKSFADNERIRADQLHEQLLKMREKWLEARRYLRAANKGAQRNAEVAQLATVRYVNNANNERRWKEKDLNDHKTIVWNWLIMSDDEYRRKFGDLTEQEICCIRKVLKEMLGTSILKHL